MAQWHYSKTRVRRNEGERLCGEGGGAEKWKGQEGRGAARCRESTEWSPGPRGRRQGGVVLQRGVSLGEEFCSQGEVPPSSREIPKWDQGSLPGRESARNWMVRVDGVLQIGCEIAQSKVRSNVPFSFSL